MINFTTEPQEVEQIAAELKGKKAGNGYLCFCPAHANTETPSLSLSLGNNGRILWKCFGGCTQESVGKALKNRGLLPHSPRESDRRTEYSPYLGLDGKPALKVTRIDQPNGKKAFYQSHFSEGRWIPGGFKGEIFPYRYDQWASETSRWIFLVEGEKCAEVLAQHGFLATTTPGGSNGWRSHFAKHFAGRDVVIIPDNDPPGRKYAASAFQDLKSQTKSVRMIELPGLGEGEDVFDWLARGNTAEDLSRLALTHEPKARNEVGQVVAQNSDEEPLLISDAKDQWPTPLSKEALHGVIGEIVTAIEPHSEADVAALLIQLLTVFGNTIGRSAYFPVEADKQHLNLFSVVVGNSSRARKGTSLGHIKRIFEHLEPEYFKTRRLSGLSSGEGLIASVRDEVTITEEDEKTGQMKTRVVDQGVLDKRGLCIETEFASVLQALRRDGNKLSAIIRDCYDHGNLSTMTRRDPLKATNSHISIIAHVTQPELRRYLNDVELLNGFANRFLWVVARRSKKLPMGGKFSLKDIESELHKLSLAISFGRRTSALSFDEPAERMWRELYEAVGIERPGLFGSLTARAEANIIRIASVYAVLDCSNILREEHLTAAIALWDYIEASIRCIFGSSTGNKNSDKILAALKERPHGLTQTEIIHEVLKRNMDRQEVAEALLVLKDAGLAHSATESSDCGRKVIKWRISENA